MFRFDVIIQFLEE